MRPCPIRYPMRDGAGYGSSANDWYDDDGYLVDDGDLVQLPDGTWALAPRSSELAPAGTDPHRRAPGGPPAEQARLRGEFGELPRNEDEQHADATAIESLGIGEMVVSPESIARLEDHGADARHVAASQKWLAENDPLRTLEGVTAAIEKSAADHGLDLRRCRAAFPKRKGRHSAVLRAHRAAVREALLPVHAADATYVLMAQALGCEKKALEVLMRS